ncbi:DNA-binding protein inhibitor ID-3-like [Hyla sarda]|uniref:DNA-binding protein inhibitor ID-3-like n=1 Tax=Hyla sarda TaxID=327740 RepID=UPI0024C370F0|nr:DNA-binding protein inhibitor ID-3-like [Hyla sarda]
MCLTNTHSQLEDGPWTLHFLNPKSSALLWRSPKHLSFTIFPGEATTITATMKAISPVRSMASCYQAVCCLSEQSLSIARSSGHKGSEEPMGLLYDMNDCYSKLRELVPGIPQGSKLSQVEILQHVIDYIFDLQIVLGEEQDNPILSLQKSDFSEVTTKGDASSICH